MTANATAIDNSPQPASDLDEAVRWHGAGQLGKAEAGYRRVLQQLPDATPATYLLAVVLLQRNAPQLLEAITLLQRCLEAPAADQAALHGMADFVDKVLPIERLLDLSIGAATMDAAAPATRLQQLEDRLQRALLQVLELRLAAMRREAAEPDEAAIFLQQLLHAASSDDAGGFFGDCLASLNKSCGFRADRKFVEAFRRNARGTTEEHGRDWRLHTLAWAARHALALDGDFVECGVFEGFMSATLCEYLDFARQPKTFYLYDTFEGFSEKYSSPEDFGIHRGFYALAQKEYRRAGLYEAVVERFAAYPNVKVIRGAVPDSLEGTMPARIAYCHIDLNSPAAEVGALERLFERVVPGGMVLFDDYGWLPFAKQKEAEDAFAAALGYGILELPTGQGLLVKR